MSPETELRSIQAGRLSATPTVKEPEAERRSTEPFVAETAMSPDPELAWRLAPRSGLDDDFAGTGLGRNRSSSLRLSIRRPSRN